MKRTKYLVINLRENDDAINDKDMNLIKMNDDEHERYMEDNWNRNMAAPLLIEVKHVMKVLNSKAYIPEFKEND